MRYDAWLSRGAGERRVVLETETRFSVGDEFKHEMEVNVVRSLNPGHDEFDAVITADLIGDKPT